MMGRRTRMTRPKQKTDSLKGATFRVFEPLPAYIQYLKRNKIKFTGKRIGRDKYGPRYEYIEFSAEDRFGAKEDYRGVAGLSGYIYRKANGKEVILQSF